MDAKETFLFDLNGYLVVRNVLTDSEVEEMNDAIDQHFSDAKPRYNGSIPIASNPYPHKII